MPRGSYTPATTHTCPQTAASGASPGNLAAGRGIAQWGSEKPSLYGCVRGDADLHALQVEIGAGSGLPCVREEVLAEGAGMILCLASAVGVSAFPTKYLRWTTVTAATLYWPPEGILAAGIHFNNI